MRRFAIPVAVLAVVLSACAGADDPAVDPPADDPATEAPDETDETDETDEDADDGADGQDEPGAPTDDEPEPDDGTDDGTDDDGTTDGGDEAPTPDAAALDDPCADHQDREGEAFIELVAPVDDQEVDGEVELVGCSSVYEGTVQFRVLDGDGVTLDEGFTTAECGGPCIGEFRETVPLDAADGEPVAYVQVFWEDASDGSERDLVERVVVLR